VNLYSTLGLDIEVGGQLGELKQRGPVIYVAGL